MIESMMTCVLQVVLLALTPSERWAAARHPFNGSSAVEGWLTGFAMAALIISLILVFFLSANHKRSLDSFKRKIDGLTTETTGLKQEMAGLRQYAPDTEHEQAPSEKSEKPVAVLEN
jgi:hypothetical protein